MSNQFHPYEPLTSENAALVLVDHQVGLMTGVRDYSIGELKHNVVALSKAAKAFDDERVSRAIAATGRKKLIFAGISLEVCAAFPAITAVGKGLDAYVAVDASGTFSE